MSQDLEAFEVVWGNSFQPKHDSPLSQLRDSAPLKQPQLLSLTLEGNTKY